MTTPEFAAFTERLAAGQGQPEATYAALCALTDALIGVKLFTLLTFDSETQLARRFYSNQPEAYPVGGTKPVPSNHWVDEVLRQGKTFVAPDAKAIADVFPDYALIQSLGCESCINIPVLVGGQVLGTLNCLHEAHHYTDGKIKASEALKLPGAAVFLLHRL
ncbi:MAG: GAF domain-containing protein [Pseudomonadota bacterium]